MAKDKEVTFENQLSVFYSLLSDLLEISSEIRSPQIRNLPLRKELEAMGRSFKSELIFRALEQLDELAAGVRRNLNKQLGLEAFAAEISPYSV